MNRRLRARHLRLIALVGLSLLGVVAWLMLEGATR
jgi:hypothetical protein